jgi:hypothetical protein
MSIEKKEKIILVPTFIEKVKWTGTALFIIGAILISISTSLSSNPWVYFTFLFGHSLWTWVGYEESDKSLMILNSSMFCMDVIAIFTRL